MVTVAGMTMMLILLQWMDYEDLPLEARHSYSFVMAAIKNLTFILIHPWPFLKEMTFEATYQSSDWSDLPYTYSLNYLLVLMALFKNIVIVMPGVLVNTNYLTPSSRRVRNMYSVSTNSHLYAVKCLFSDSPWKLMMITLVIGIFFFSFGIRVIERSVPI
jgi:hypothetical protein